MCSRLSRSVPLATAMRPSGSKVDPITALFPIAAGVEGVVLGNSDDAHQDAAEAFAGPSRCEVVGVAGDPERLDAVGTGQGEQQAAGALGVSAAARGRVDVVAHVAVVH